MSDERRDVSYARDETARKVFAVLGTPPEELAYTMASYSRSRRSFLESNRYITGQKAANFLETFYFAYGHRSIADMAHIPLAIENISILAAIEVVAEQLWDGQERSTRATRTLLSQATAFPKKSKRGRFKTNTSPPQTRSLPPMKR